MVEGLINNLPLAKWTFCHENWLKMSENSTEFKTKQKVKPEKAFLHVFLKEGLDDNKLLEAKENVEALIQEYQDLEKHSDSTNLRENENEVDVSLIE